LPTVKWAGLFVAQELGMFAEEGVDVEVLEGGPVLRGAGRAVVAGSAEIGLASDLLDIVRLVGGGAPLRVVGATVAATPLGIAWLAPRAVESMADLVGLRLGAGTDDDRNVLDALFVANDLEPYYDFTLTGAGLDELIAGGVDAMCCSTLSQVPAAVRQGFPVESATFGDLGLPMAGDVVVVGSSYLADHRGEVVAFLRALGRGWSANASDPSLGVEATMSRHGATHGFVLADVEAENLLNLAHMTAAATPGASPLAVDVAALDATLAAMARAGVGPLPSSATEVVDPTVLQMALAR
jgi:ABC-type nitrate/sulfonate/bicarbonate transport system substrate-binding protein